MSKILIALSLVAALFFGVTAISGCGDKDIDDAAREAGDALKEAGEDVGKIVEGAVDAVEDAVKDAKD